MIYITENDLEGAIHYSNQILITFCNENEEEIVIDIHATPEKFQEGTFEAYLYIEDQMPHDFFLSKERPEEDRYPHYIKYEKGEIVEMIYEGESDPDGEYQYLIVASPEKIQLENLLRIPRLRQAEQLEGEPVLLVWPESPGEFVEFLINMGML